MATNCFVSYHHEYDQDYVNEFRLLHPGRTVSDFSLKEDISHLEEDTIYQKIRDKMRNCSVTIVLVGEKTGYRKWIDWELWASLRPYRHPTDPRKSFKPNGLLAIYLPNCSSYSVPDRLQDNIDSGFAVEMHWNYIRRDLTKRLAQCQENRNKSHKIDNSREQMSRNSWNFLGIKI